MKKGFQHRATLGLGCVTFGREIDETSSFKLMDHAFANGIVEFDTAAVYGNGASEEMIGKWLAEDPKRKEKVKVATKIIPPFNTDQITAAVEGSLRRLRLDAVDLLYLHRWNETLKDGSAWLALEELLFQGKIKAIGVSNFDFHQLIGSIEQLRMITPLRISTIQNNHNLAVSDLSDEIIGCCEQEAIEIVTFSPLGAGFLTGKHLNGVAQGSRFELMPAHQAIYFNEDAQSRLSRLLGVAARTGNDPAFLALAWAIHQPCTARVLVGGRSIDQLDLALQAAKFQDMDLLASLLIR